MCTNILWILHSTSSTSLRPSYFKMYDWYIAKAKLFQNILSVHRLGQVISNVRFRTSFSLRIKIFLLFKKVHIKVQYSIAKYHLVVCVNEKTVRTCIDRNCSSIFLSRIMGEKAVWLCGWICFVLSLENQHVFRIRIRFHCRTTFHCSCRYPYTDPYCELYISICLNRSAIVFYWFLDYESMDNSIIILSLYDYTIGPIV